jgi:hypothetical protein
MSSGIFCSELSFSDVIEFIVKFWIFGITYPAGLFVSKLLWPFWLPCWASQVLGTAHSLCVLVQLFNEQCFHHMCFEVPHCFQCNLLNFSKCVCFFYFKSIIRCCTADIVENLWDI